MTIGKRVLILLSDQRGFVKESGCAIAASIIVAIPFAISDALKNRQAVVEPNATEKTEKPKKKKKGVHLTPGGFPVDEDGELDLSKMGR